MATRKKPRGVSVQQYDKIEELAAQGFEGRAIHAELNRLGLLDPNDLPGEWTVQRIVRDLAPSDEVMREEQWRAARQPWQLGAGAENEAVMLRVLAGVLGSPGLPWPTAGQSAWILRLARAVPDLADRPDGWRELYRFALVYQGRIEREESTGDLDAYFALAPWRDGGAAYLTAICSGRISRVHGGPFTPEAAWSALQALAKATVKGEQVQVKP